MGSEPRSAGVPVWPEAAAGRDWLIPDGGGAAAAGSCRHCHGQRTPSAARDPVALNVWFDSVLRCGGEDDPSLGDSALARPSPIPKMPFWVSAASAWEIVIKVALGRLSLAAPAAQSLPTALAENDFSPLPISLDHALAVAGLPRLHGDAFDQMTDRPGDGGIADDRYGGRHVRPLRRAGRHRRPVTATRQRTVAAAGAESRWSGPRPPGRFRNVVFPAG